MNGPQPIAGDRLRSASSGRHEPGERVGQMIERSPVGQGYGQAWLAGGVLCDVYSAGVPAPVVGERKFPRIFGAQPEPFSQAATSGPLPAS